MEFNSITSKTYFTLISFCFYSFLNAQTGIGTEFPKAETILDIQSEEMGIVIPRIELDDLNNLNPIAADTAIESLLVFNTSELTGKGFYYWNGTGKWIAVGSENHSKSTTAGLQFYFYNLPATNIPPDIRDFGWNIRINRSGFHDGELLLTETLILYFTGNTGGGNNQNILFRMVGYYTVKNAGTFQFLSTANDGARIYVDESLILNRWEDTDGADSTGSVYLSKGKHKFEFWFYRDRDNSGTGGGGGAAFNFKWGINPDGHIPGTTIQATAFSID